MTDGRDRTDDGLPNRSSNERSIESTPVDGPSRRPAVGAETGDRGSLPARERDAADSGVGRAPDIVAVLASTAGLEAGAWVVLRYVPEYLRTLGVGAPLIGAFGSLWLIGRWVASERIRPGRLWIALAALAAAVGLTLWALAPALAGASATSAWTLLAAGAIGVAAWSCIGTARPVERWPLSHVNGTTSPDQAGWTVAALVVAFAVLALARSFEAGFRVVLALSAALAVAVAALWAVGDLDVTPPALETTGRATNATVGDVVNRFGLAMVSMFVVVVVTTVLDVDVVVLGRELGPATTFGLFLVAELVTATVTTRVGPRIVEVLGQRAAGIYASLVAAAFPLVLVSAPGDPVAVAAVFAVYGSRALGRVARQQARVPAADREIAPTVDADRDSDVEIVETRSHRTASAVDAGRRLTADRLAIVVVAAPAIGGLLYAVSPVLAFGTATAVGAVGAWERIRSAVAQ